MKNHVPVEETMKKMIAKTTKSNRYTTTQLRLLLSNAVVIKNKTKKYQLKAGDLLPNEIENDVKYLLIKHIYQCGRDKKVDQFDRDFKISENIKGIGNSFDSFNSFYRYLEEIVAYTKYYESEK